MTRLRYLLAATLTLQAADIPERICRSPKLYDMRQFQIYAVAADVMHATYEDIEKVSMMKVENYGHIENVAYPVDADQFERSRNALVLELLRLEIKKLNAETIFKLNV